jgi:DNA-binding NarL/FixJ family response regulator
MAKIRLVLGDEAGFLLDALDGLVKADERFEVVGKASETAALIELVERVRPDLALIDPILSASSAKIVDRGDLEVVTKLSGASPGTRVVVMSNHEDARYLRAAIMAGARGFVSKRITVARLYEALTAVQAGRSHVDVSLSDSTTTNVPLANVPAANNGASNGAGSNGAGSNGADQPSTNGTDLSRREREVLAMIAGGFTNREVAERLGLSVKTVESYRSRAMRKIGASSRAQLVRYAVLTGLLEVA